MTNFKGHLVKGLGLSTLVLGGAMGVSVFAQSAATDSSSQPAASTQPAYASSNSAVDPNDSATYATGKPLQGQSKEGFWGHMNPFARKKWVARTVEPIRDRTNELDQLQSKNANDIRDVDSRAQSGIHNALMAANTADQHAADAASRANAAQTTATGASSKTDALNGTVSNLDQYNKVTEADVKFASGRTTLGQKGKATLDDMALKLASEKGYIIEVQGFSRGGVATSQAMADSVVRYLVTDHQVPLYRVYRTGLGRAAHNSNDGETALVNGVRVTLLHNSLATMGSTTASNTEPAAAPGQTAVPSTTGSVSNQ
ncbi:MAG TPA: OmpA family protein [Acidobacteriaceae bacterium]|nr:OmpA family protein [Acidobacteriaceae bacterium]